MHYVVITLKIIDGESQQRMLESQQTILANYIERWYVLMNLDKRGFNLSNTLTQKCSTKRGKLGL